MQAATPPSQPRASTFYNTDSCNGTKDFFIRSTIFSALCRLGLYPAQICGHPFCIEDSCRDVALDRNKLECLICNSVVHRCQALYTIEATCEFLPHIINEWSLGENVFIITENNAPDVVKGFHFLKAQLSKDNSGEYNHFTFQVLCMAHMISLGVKEGYFSLLNA